MSRSANQGLVPVVNVTTLFYKSSRDRELLRTQMSANTANERTSHKNNIYSIVLPTRVTEYKIFIIKDKYKIQKTPLESTYFKCEIIE